MAAIESNKQIEWRRVSEAFPKATLFGNHGVVPADLKQGYIGNCWFISALAALAEFPDRIERLFLNVKNEHSMSGLYGVNFYTLGHEHTILIDDFIPVINEGEAGYTTLYAGLGDDMAMWAPLIEKAFAKRFGNYEHIVGGLPSEAFKTLTGSPSIMYEHKDVNAETLW